MLSAELKAFYMVARLGSITQAAKKLGLSQPTVTTQIRNLESQYSVELFYRGGRRLSVSEEGARLIRWVLGSDPLVLAVHRNHPLAVHDHVPLGALAGHTLLMREPGSTTRRLTEELLASAGVCFGPLLEIGSRESIREAVLRNIGISIIARQEVPHDPQLRVLTIENAPQISEYLYCLKERKGARLPAAFLGLAQEMDPA